MRSARWAWEFGPLAPAPMRAAVAGKTVSTAFAEYQAAHTTARGRSLRARARPRPEAAAGLQARPALRRRSGAPYRGGRLRAGLPGWRCGDAREHGRRGRAAPWKHWPPGRTVVANEAVKACRNRRRPHWRPTEARGVCLSLARRLGNRSVSGVPRGRAVRSGPGRSAAGRAPERSESVLPDAGYEAAVGGSTEGLAVCPGCTTVDNVPWRLRVSVHPPARAAFERRPLPSGCRDSGSAARARRCSLARGCSDWRSPLPAAAVRTRPSNGLWT